MHIHLSTCSSQLNQSELVVNNIEVNTPFVLALAYASVCVSFLMNGLDFVGFSRSEREGKTQGVVLCCKVVVGTGGGMVALREELAGWIRWAS